MRAQVVERRSGRMSARVAPYLTKDLLILFLVGVALSILQFLMIRDFVTVLYGEEVVIVLVTTAFFAGLSGGYLIAPRLSKTVFEALFVATAFLHLSFPFSYRYLAAWFATMDVGGYGYLALLFVYAVVFNTVYATFLPRLISAGEGKTDKRECLKSCYGAEILGFMAGFLVVGLTWNKPLALAVSVYWVVLCAVLYLATGRKWVVGVYAVFAAAIGFYLGDLDYHSTAQLYEHKHHKRAARTLITINSPYQKVEVIEDGKGVRYLYLDGLKNLNSTDLEALNFYIAELPARLIRPSKSLLIGNGTLTSVPKLYPYSGEVVSVELDPGVLIAGKRFFTPPRVLKGLGNWRLFVDDGKHFLGNSEEKFDLIVMDIPSPLTIQEAGLYTAEFYKLARSRMTPSGVIAVLLGGRLRRDNRAPARITAALREGFPEVMAIYSKKAGRGFAYASVSLPFGPADVLGMSRTYESTKLRVVRPEKIDSYLTEAVPLSVDRMDIVLRRGWERFTNRYFRKRKKR